MRMKKIKIRPQRLLRSIDLFGENFNFKVEGEDAFKTLVGGIVSIFFVITFGFAVYSSISKLFDTKNPEVSINQFTTLEVPEMDFFQNDFIIAISGFRFPGLVKGEDIFKIITPVAQVYELFADPASLGLEFIPRIVNTIPIVPCRSIANKRISDTFKISEVESRIFNDFSVCPDIDQDSH